jgi:hypothetical protein
MRIVKLSSEQFGGFDRFCNGYKIKTNSGTEIVRECKVISKDGDKVAFCKPGGIIEPAFATRKRYGNDTSFVEVSSVSLFV